MLSAKLAVSGKIFNRQIPLIANCHFGAAK
jgi:hypothetical protein